MSKTFASLLDISMMLQKDMSSTPFVSRTETDGFTYASFLDLSTMLQKMARFCRSGEASQTRQFQSRQFALFKYSLKM